MVPATGRVLVPFLTQFADFDSWELAQKLVDDLPRLEEAGVAVVAVGAQLRGLGERVLRQDQLPDGQAVRGRDGAHVRRQLRFAPGFGREGGALGWLESAAPFVNGYAKLLVMCAGIGSPGTLAAVFGGYLGNKNADPIFKEGSNYDNAFIRGAMDATLGSGYQRPFELATLRLTNMTAILNEWDALAPADDAMLRAKRRVLRVRRRPSDPPRRRLAFWGTAPWSGWWRRRSALTPGRRPTRCRRFEAPRRTARRSWTTCTRPSPRSRSASRRRARRR